MITYKLNVTSILLMQIFF